MLTAVSAFARKSVLLPDRRGGRIRRREAIALLAGAVAFPLAASGQQPGPARRIGILMALPQNDPGGRAELEALRGGLAELGWVEGRTLEIEIRSSASGDDRLAGLARELAAQRPEILMARGTPAVTAVVAAAPATPTVFLQVADPVGAGFVHSMAHPGGEVTGITSFVASLGGKWLGLLKEIAPHIDEVAVLFNPDTAPYAGAYMRTIEEAAPVLGIRPVAAAVRNPAELEAAIAAIGRTGKGGLVQLPDTFTVAHRDRLIELVARHRVPAVYSNRFFTASNGLMSYAADSRAIFVRAASYVDRILKGAKPAELPVEQPTKFELVINLKAAKTLGFTIPDAVLLRADEVIE